MAMQMSMTCQFIDAQQALRIGLLNEVVPPENLMPRAKEIASQICANNFDMLMTVKRLIEYRRNATLTESYKHEGEEFGKFKKKMMSLLKSE